MWKVINCEPCYEISSTGEIRNIKTGHIKSVRSDRYGYHRVTLYPSGKTYTIHRLVALTFLENTKNLDQVNHKNGIKTDNNVENLEWCDCSHNSKHRSNVLYPDKFIGEANYMSVLKEADVLRIKYGDLSTLCNKVIAELFGINPEQVRRIKKGDRWKHL
jgi:hypothetical protein